jgi:bla regulator protein blaR1
MRNQLRPRTCASRVLVSSVLFWGLALVLAVIAVGAICGRAVANQAATSGADASVSNWEKAAGGHLEFEAASVKLTKQPTTLGKSNVPLDAEEDFTPTGGLFSSPHSWLTIYIAFAYKLPRTQIYGLAAQLPKWVASDLYAIEARAAGNPTKDQYRLMMQSLLADRFKLAFHYETKPTQVLALVLDKPGKLGPNLRQHPGGEDCSMTLDDAGGPTPTVSGDYPQPCGKFYELMPAIRTHYAGGARNVPMTAIADSLSQFYGYPKPIVDATGLAGNYDCLMDFALAVNGVLVDENGPTFLEALKDQLGLKLEEKTMPLRVMVIDHVEEPSEN